MSNFFSFRGQKNFHDGYFLCKLKLSKISKKLAKNILDAFLFFISNQENFWIGNFDYNLI